ncbi:MAG: type I-E CRISPR-associated endonuclease Cas1e [Candidatus Brocadiia bacterium]
MLKGRLGLETTGIPHADRHGLIYLERGKLYVEDGCLTFVTAGTNTLSEGIYQIPYQGVSNFLLAPGCSVSHDAMRLLARHGTGLLVVGAGGVRFYAASMPFGADRSALARAQTSLWADQDSRLAVARRMYAMRIGEELPQQDLDALRGVEGHRMKQVYKNMAQHFGVQWHGRRYDRTNPAGDDLPNSALNHASTAVRAAAMVAVAATSTIPQLGFIHEASAEAFVLDIADLHRTSLTIPIAFQAAKTHQRQGWENIERITRRLAGKKLRERGVIAEMIDNIKELLNDDDRGGQS